MSLQKLLKEYPPRPRGFPELYNFYKIYIKRIKYYYWDFDALSTNQNLTFQDVLDNLNQDWNWFSLSLKLNLTIKDILKYPNLPWDFPLLSANKNITLNDILNNPQIPWDWIGISYNPNIRARDIINHPDKKWSAYLLSANKNIDFINIPSSFELDWSLISLNETLTMSDILNNLDKQWNWYYLSGNKNLTITDIYNYRYLPWNWDTLSQYLKCSLREFYDNRDLPWNWSNISINKNITPREILGKLSNDPNKNFAKDYISINYTFLSSHPKLTIQDIGCYPSFHWKWPLISAILPTKYIFNNRLYPWPFEDVATNPNITIKFIRKNIDTINFYKLSSNDFNYSKKKTIKYIKILDMILPHDLSLIITNFQNFRNL